MRVVPDSIQAAPTGRAKCRGCGKAIAKAELRFGETGPNTYGEGEATTWFHLPCAALMRPEKLVPVLETHTDEVPERAGLVETARFGIEHRRLPRMVRVERASSGRAHCRSCRELIDKGEWRFVLQMFEEGRPNPIGTIHVSCAEAYFGTADVLAELRPALDPRFDGRRQRRFEESTFGAAARSGKNAGIRQRRRLQARFRQRLSQACRVLRQPLVTCSLLLVASSVRAQSIEEAVRFQYVAPSECPDAASFAARVRERTERGREANEGELARSFSVNIRADSPGFLGGIEFLDEGGQNVSRRVHGEQCDAVVSSLALITALALDATLRPADEPAVAAAAQAPRPAEAPAPTPAVAVPTSAPVAPLPRKLTSARVGVAGAYDSSLPALPLALLGQLDWRSGVALRFSAHFASEESLIDEGRRAKLRLLGLATSVCPWRFRNGQFALAPCASFDVGALRAEGEQSAKLPTAGNKAILWAAAGAEARVASGEPAAPYWLELSGGVGFPLVRKGFKFDLPEADVYDVPSVTGTLGVATGVRFW